MGNPHYHEAFPKDSTIRIADRVMLENFLTSWQFHNKLQPDQLNYSDQVAQVESVGFYHGGDVLYTLKDIPSIWHEQCLRVV